MFCTTRDRTKLQALATELVKDIKTEADLNAWYRELLNLTAETALNVELTEHLSYEKQGSISINKKTKHLGALLPETIADFWFSTMPN
jgi:transposase-like protein